jgi:hypothetical protein
MEIKEYYQKIKELQLDGTLNTIREEIRLHYVSEFKKQSETPNHKMVHIHLNDRLMELLGADSKLDDQISYYYYELMVNDEDFKNSVQEYNDKVEAIKNSKRKKDFSDIVISKDTLKDIEEFIKLLSK